MYALIANENYCMHFCNLQLLYSIVCSTVIDNFGCSTSMETFWVHYYIWKYLPATIKLTTDRPMKGLTDRLTDIVTYIVAIASKNIQIFSWGWGSVTKQLSFFLFYLYRLTNVIVCFCFFVGGRGLLSCLKKVLSSTLIA